MPHDVFLSYASADRAAADAVCVALESRGIACWIAPRDVPAGADWGEAILTAIGRAHAMVLVLSRNTASSVHVRNEVVTAVSQNLALVPVRIEDCQPGGALRLHLAGSHWLNGFPPPVDQHADALVAGVRLALAADATIELPRAQAAALVTAARAAVAAGPLPVASPRSPAKERAAPLRAAAPDPAPHVPRKAGGRGAAIAIGLALLVLLGAAAVSAWMFEPHLRALLGWAPAAPTVAAAVPTVVNPPASGPAPRATPPPAAPPAPVQAQPARLVNTAAETISRLFVALPGEGVGREDWLGQAQITPGNAVLVPAPPGQGCLFNIRVVYVGGRTEDRPGVDLCAGGELRFDGGKAVAASR